ncbi:MAG TPA: outer membrane beta-barrel protein [Nevskiaceae bacterium]|nr:outer membrane beta-barrel protein [Nevskiaceae bacterium]
MKHGIFSMAALAALAASSVAQAGGYAGAGLGYSSFLSRNDQATLAVAGAPTPVTEKIDGALSGTFYAGWRDEHYPVMAEVAYLDMGNHKFSLTAASGSQEDRYGLKAINLSAGVIPWRHPNGSAVWVKAGYYNGDASDKFASSDGFNLQYSQKTAGLSAALGGELALAPGLALRLEYLALINARDYSDDDGRGRSTLGLATLGLTFNFGSRDGAHGSAAHMSSGMTAAAAPVAAPVPVAAPAPIHGPALRAGTALRGRPTPDASAVATYAAETPVQVLSRAENNSGSWCYVKVGDVVGWVPDTQVRP